MSHIPRLTGDPATAAEIVLRRARNAVIVFKFLVDGLQIPIEDDFVLRIKQNDRAGDNILELSIGDGLVIDGDDLRAVFTEGNSAIDQYKCVYELFNRTTGQTWIASKIYFNTGEPVEGTTSEVSSTINTGDQVIEVDITIPPIDGELDGGFASSVYLNDQIIDGGNA